MKRDYRTHAWETRFWALVDRDHVGTGCWMWTGSSNGVGYGQFYAGAALRQDPSRYAHRIAFALENGAIPEGLDLDHLCRNRSCVNPAHLEAVTRSVNVSRGSLNDAKKALTHCPRGHEYSGANVYCPPSRAHLANGGRECVACRRDAGIRNRDLYNARRRERRAYMT